MVACLFSYDRLSAPELMCSAGPAFSALSA